MKSASPPFSLAVACFATLLPAQASGRDRNSYSVADSAAVQALEPLGEEGLPFSGTSSLSGKGGTIQMKIGPERWSTGQLLFLGGGWKKVAMVPIDMPQEDLAALLDGNRVAGRNSSDCRGQAKN